MNGNCFDPISFVRALLGEERAGKAVVKDAPDLTELEWFLKIRMGVSG